MADFSGVTFAKQNVTPADDGLIRRALLSDGVLTGCNFSYSGYTLTMGSGVLIACGRQIRHPSAQNWAVVGAKSGYARLVLDIDLTKSSTKDLFEQVSASLEYATAENGFTDLTQEDLNVAGSKYQIVLCVVSLGDAGITGIVSQLDAAEGAGGGLAYSVVSSLSEPKKKEGLIWVKSAVKATHVQWDSGVWDEAPVGWVDIEGVLGGENPSSTSKTILIFDTTQSSISHAMKITPTLCRQVQGDVGNWVNLDAYVCHDNTWVQFSSTWNGELFDNGDQYAQVTGGWVGNNYTTIGTTLQLNVSNSRPIISTVNAIDLSGYTTLHCIADLQMGKVGVAGTKDLTAEEPAWTASTNLAAQEVTVDISSIQSGYIQLFAGGSWTATVNATKVWLT